MEKREKFTGDPYIPGSPSPQNKLLKDLLTRFGWLAGPLFESPDETVSLLDIEYNILMVSKALADTLGRDVIGKKCYNVYQNRDCVCPNCPTDKLLTTGKASSSAGQTGVDGRTYSIRSLPLTDNQGKILAVLELAFDITGRRNSEEDLKSAHDFWSTVFNSSGDLISVINVSDFKITEANKAFLDAYGLKRDEAVGRTCYEVTHHTFKACSGPNNLCPS